MTSSARAITKPEDLKGMKMRVPPSPFWVSMFKAFEASPASINFAEVYTALQTKIVDGQANLRCARGTKMVADTFVDFLACAYRLVLAQSPADRTPTVTRAMSATSMGYCTNDQRSRSGAL